MKDIVSGIVLDEQVSFNLADLCRVCKVSADLVIEMVDEGLFLPVGGGPREWRFCGTDVRKMQITRRLQRDLRVNLAGAALALELLEEIEELKRRIGNL